MEFLPDFDVSLVLYLFCLFAGLALIQLFYVLLIHGRLAFYTGKKQPKSDVLLPVSVIIAARNESDNLYQNLPIILEQDYPNF